MPVNGTHIESTQVAFVAGSPTKTNFRVGTVSTAMRRLVLTTDADVYIHFDADADDTCFVLQAGCPLQMDFINFTTISVQGVNGAGTLYVLAMRD